MANKQIQSSLAQELADNLNNNVREEIKSDLINSAVAISDSLRTLLRQEQIPGVIHQRAIQQFVEMVDRYKEIVKSQ